MNSEPFEDFLHNGKSYELRGYGRNYTEKQVYEGRKVELRRGYSGASQWGVIGEVIIGDSIITEFATGDDWDL